MFYNSYLTSAYFIGRQLGYVKTKREVQPYKAKPLASSC